jgi:hypothetical protein
VLAHTVRACRFIVAQYANAASWMNYVKNFGLDEPVSRIVLGTD